MTRTRIILATLFLPALAVAATLTGPTAAQAESTDCPADYVCMWEDNDFQGSMYVRQPANIGSYDIDGWDGDNEISSYYINASFRCVTMYADDNWKGAVFHTFRWGPKLKSLSELFDNEAESYTIYEC